MSKKLYPNVDIADLVDADLNPEETFYKGGPGSGVKGHKTAEDPSAQKPEKIRQPEPTNVHGDKHNGEYGFHTSGNKDEKASQAETEKRNAKFDQAVKEDKARQLESLSAKLKADGQKHGAKVVDKKLKEMSSADPGEKASNESNKREDDRGAKGRDPSLPKRNSDKGSYSAEKVVGQVAFRLGDKIDSDLNLKSGKTKEAFKAIVDAFTDDMEFDTMEDALKHVESEMLSEFGDYDGIADQIRMISKTI